MKPSWSAMLANSPALEKLQNFFRFAYYNHHFVCSTVLPSRNVVLKVQEPATRVSEWLRIERRGLLHSTSLADHSTTTVLCHSLQAPGYSWPYLYSKDITAPRLIHLACVHHRAWGSGGKEVGGLADLLLHNLALRRVSTCQCWCPVIVTLNRGSLQVLWAVGAQKGWSVRDGVCSEYIKLVWFWSWGQKGSVIFPGMTMEPYSFLQESLTLCGGLWVVHICGASRQAGALCGTCQKVYGKVFWVGKAAMQM